MAALAAPKEFSLVDLPDEDPLDDPLGMTSDSPLAPQQRGRRLRPSRQGVDWSHLFRTYGLAVGVGVLGLFILLASDAIVKGQEGADAVFEVVPFFVGKLIGLVGIGVAVHGIILRRQRSAEAEANVVEQYAGQGIAYGLLLLYFLLSLRGCVLILRVAEGWDRTEALMSVGIFLTGFGVAAVAFAEVSKRYGFFRTAACTYLTLFGAVPICMIVLTVPIRASVGGVFARATGIVEKREEELVDDDTEGTNTPGVEKDDPVTTLPEELPLPSLPQIGVSSKTPLPGFPPTGTFSKVGDNVYRARVQLQVPPGDAGQQNQLFVLKPGTDLPARSRPCVLMAPSGAVEFAGVKSGYAPDKEQMTHAERGFVVIGFEVDGPMPSGGYSASKPVKDSFRRFHASRAGLINARNALQFALTRVPEVDPTRIYAAGFGSAGTLALLMAAHDSEIAACAVGEPVTMRGVTRSEQKYEEMLAPGARQFLRDHSPDSLTENFNCPVFIYLGNTTGAGSAGDSKAFAAALAERGGLVESQVGGTGAVRRDHGLAARVEWLANLAGLPMEPEEKPEPPLNGQQLAGYRPPEAAPTSETEFNKACTEYMHNDLLDTAVGPKDRVLARLRWFAAAKRPSTGLRWGLGAILVGQAVQPNMATMPQLEQVAGRPGVLLANRLQEGIEADDFGEWSHPDAAWLHQLVSLGAGPLATLKQRAQQKGVDAFLMLSITREIMPVTKQERVRMKARLYDVRGEVDVWASDEITKAQIAAGMRKGTDPSDLWASAVLETIDKQYYLGPMPNITADLAKQRASSLRRMSTPVLERIIELRYYHARDLLNDVDTADALDAIIGSGKGQEFLDGDDATRRKIVADAVRG